MVLSEQAFKKIDRELAKFPADQRQSAVMAAFAIAQDENGWLVARSHARQLLTILVCRQLQYRK